MHVESFKDFEAEWRAASVSGPGESNNDETCSIIVATIYGNTEPMCRFTQFRKKNSRHEIKVDNEMNEEKNHGVYPSIPVHDPRKIHWQVDNKSPGILWDTPTLSVQFDIGNIPRSRMSSSPFQPLVETRISTLNQKPNLLTNAFPWL